MSAKTAITATAEMIAINHPDTTTPTGGATGIASTPKLPRESPIST